MYFGDTFVLAGMVESNGILSWYQQLTSYVLIQGAKKNGTSIARGKIQFRKIGKKTPKAVKDAICLFIELFACAMCETETKLQLIICQYRQVIEGRKKHV